MSMRGRAIPSFSSTAIRRLLICGGTSFRTCGVWALRRAGSDRDGWVWTSPIWRIASSITSGTWLAFLDAPNCRRVAFVLHDWGSALGFDGDEHADRVRGLAFMEALLIAPIPSWDGFPAAVRENFRRLARPKSESAWCSTRTLFVEQLLPGAVLRGLTEGRCSTIERRS